MLFVGAFERQLDDKGRLALPAAFRDRLGDFCYLAKGHDKSVTVVPGPTFEEEAEIDLDTVRADITRLESELATVRAKMQAYLEELGV